MKKYSSLAMLMIAAFCSPSLYADGINLDCKTDKPKLQKALTDQEITVYNMAHIATAGTFIGPQLAFTVTASPHKKKNELAISSRMGELVISAGEIDKFDVTVIATNGCGQAKSSFKVIVAAEEE